MNMTDQSLLSEAADAAFQMTISVLDEQDTTTAAAASSAAAMASQEELLFFPYQEGEVIERKWHLGFFLLAYVAAFIGSHTGIRILEHGLWRSEQEKQHATFISKYPRFAMSLVLGSCAIWSMHFIGMQAEELLGIDSVVCYDWVPTIGSLLLSVTGVWAGVVVAGWDIFAGPDRVDILKRLVRCDTALVVARNSVSSSSSRPDHLSKNQKETKKTQEQLGSYHIHCIAFFDMLHWIAAGSFLAALGALSMHYVGMIAMKGPFHREWSFVFISASVFFGVVICFVGFWILFRPLHFKVEKSWYRLASAAIIALAICFLHFFGMFAVTYTADASQAARTQCEGSHFFQGWKLDQFQVLIVAMVVPMVGLLVEHTISNELRVTYRQLLDIRLSGSEFLEESKDDVEEGGTSITATKESTTTTTGSEKVSTNGSKKSSKRKPAPSGEMMASAREDPSDTLTCADLSGLMCNDDMYSHSFGAGVWPDGMEHQETWSDHDTKNRDIVGKEEGSLASSGDVEEWGADEP